MEHPLPFPMNDSDIYNRFIMIDRLFKYHRGVLDAHSERIDEKAHKDLVGTTESWQTSNDKKFAQHDSRLMDIMKELSQLRTQVHDHEMKLSGLKAHVDNPPAVKKPYGYDFPVPEPVALVNMEPRGDVPAPGYHLYRCDDGTYDVINGRGECIAENITADQLVRAFLRHGNVS